MNRLCEFKKEECISYGKNISKNEKTRMVHGSVQSCVYHRASMA